MKGSTDKDQPVYNMTLMPTNMRGFFSKEELKNAELVDGGRYSHHLPVLQVPAYRSMGSFFRWPDALYDKTNDPGQNDPVTDPELIKHMTARLKDAMEAADAPDWQYKRLGIEK